MKIRSSQYKVCHCRIVHKTLAGNFNVKNYINVMIQIIAKYTAMVCVPAAIGIMYGQMQENFPEVVCVLHYIECSAWAASVDTKKKLLKLLPNTLLHNTWGSTETGGAIFLDITHNPDKLGSIGRPLDGIQLKTVDKNGK